MRYSNSFIVSVLLLAITLPLNVAIAAGNHTCSTTSRVMFLACRAEIVDDYYEEYGKCINENENDEITECLQEARATLNEEKTVCFDVREARDEVCDAIGQGPYDPSFEEEDFETSLDALSVPNLYYPMSTGNKWTYGGGEDIVVEILNQTKLIDDITCFVVQDVVSEDGRLVEDTDDWFAVSKIDGGIWYCGEEAKDYEYFEGDEPSLPELVSIDGSFKVERERDRAGMVIPGTFQVGHVFRQEFSLGNAEDIGEIISIDYGYGKNDDLDDLVPKDLADLLCNNDCVIVKEYTPLEPDGFERKYYAPGIGFFLATNPEDEESVQLIECNFSSLCDDLPKP